MGKFLKAIFHRCHFVKGNKPMLHTCSCGRQRWGLYDEGVRD